MSPRLYSLPELIRRIDSDPGACDLAREMADRVAGVSEATLNAALCFSAWPDSDLDELAAGSRLLDVIATAGDALTIANQRAAELRVSLTDSFNEAARLRRELDAARRQIGELTARKRKPAKPPAPLHSADALRPITCRS